MRWILLLIFLIACSKEKSNDQGELQATPGATGEPTVSVPNVTPIANPNPSIKVGSTFLVDTSGKCDFDASNFDVLFLDPQIEPGCVDKFNKTVSHVGAYLSAGSAEDWRSDWKELSKLCVSDYKGWPGECHLGLNKLDQVMTIMKKRMDDYKKQGFQSVYLDNGTMYEDCPGVTIAQNIEYFKQLSEYAHSVGLQIGPNGGGEVIAKTVGMFDFYMIEDVLEYGGTKNYNSVNGKYAIFNIVYDKCDELSGFSTALMSGLKFTKFKKTCDYKAPVQITPVAPATPVTKPTPAKKVTLPDGIDEASGITYSKTTKQFYLINDSGNAADIFVLDESLNFIKRVKTGLKNIDWEAISWSDGKLYVGDIGSNGADRSSKTIYVLNEEDFKLIETIKIPMVKDFNSEGMAIWEDAIYLSEKNYDNEPLGIWQWKDNKLTKWKEFKLPKGKACLGDLSVNSKGQFILPGVGDGDGIAWVIDQDKLTEVKIKPLGQIESLTWIDDTSFVYTSEGGGSLILKGSI